MRGDPFPTYMNLKYGRERILKFRTPKATIAPRGTRAFTCRGTRLRYSGKKAVSLFGEAAFGYTALYFFVFFGWFTDFKCRCELLFDKSVVHNIAQYAVEHGTKRNA